MAVEHRGTKEMWADGNTKPLQGAGFRTFRSKVMGMSEDYNDDAERVRIHPNLLPKPKKAGVVPLKDLEVLAKVMGVRGATGKLPNGSTPPMTPAKVGQRSLVANV